MISEKERHPTTLSVVTRELVLLITITLFMNCSGRLHTDSAQSEMLHYRAMVASAHPIASNVGIDILKKGGNAVDAALATAFALSIAEPNASGIGGGGFMIIKMADQKEPLMIDYRESAPAAATKAVFYESDKNFSEIISVDPFAVGVPGLVRCAEVLLDSHCALSLDELLAPSIALCESGVEVSPKLSGMITDNYEKLSQYPSAMDIYLSDMLPLQPGDTLRNPDLAATFRNLAKNGGESFYKGDMANKLASTVKEHGGLMESTDLSNYEAIKRTPVSGSYRGYQIISSAPPSGGGTHIIEMLNILEGFDLKKLGHNSAQTIHLLTETMKMVYADKSKYAADPDYVSVPVDSLTSKKHAARLRRRILLDRARFDYSPPDLIYGESGSTSHLSIVDDAGNIVALTQSINHWFGSGIVVPGTGILLNDHLKDFSKSPDSPNAIEPGKRPTSSIAPTIVLKDGAPFMTLGTPGGARIISALAQIIINVIDFGMDMDQAIEAPRVHCLKSKLHLEGRISEAIVSALETLGHKVQLHSEYDNYFGGAQGILIDLQNETLQGGADSRRDGVAIGY
ncbi:MAG: gamma-glutamyltransferase [candidate division KSB1 bacterium]|jgi:gamma-glutamyltranspeptidase/glutathione hydrolase|nr:gamma-glutamyltransferase [candidate division KSB1 bacterium]